MLTPRPPRSFPLLLALALLAGSAALSSARSPAVRARPTASGRAPVVVIVMENHEYSQIVGSSAAPYINKTLIPAGRLFTNYHANFHPSLPNYLAMTSGTADGCRSDGCFSSGGKVRPTDRKGNIFHQLARARISFRTYAESMSHSCLRSTSYRDYAARHNPEAYYRNLAVSHLCKKTDVRMSALVPSRLPAFSFVVPNVCHDMHTNCGVNPITAGDTWLATHVPALLKSGAIVIVTFDEGTTSSGGGGHVLTVEVGPSIPKASRSSLSYTHYGLLAGLETYFGVPRANGAAKARPLPI